MQPPKIGQDQPQSPTPDHKVMQSDEEDMVEIQMEEVPPFVSRKPLSEAEDHKFLVPAPKNPVFSLEAQICSRLAPLCHFYFTSFQELISEPDATFTDPQLLSFKKYGFWQFTFDTHIDAETYWQGKEGIFVAVFGAELARKKFDELRALLPGGVKMLAYSEQAKISPVYELIGHSNLRIIFHAAREYLKEYSTQLPPSENPKIKAIHKLIKQKCQQAFQKIAELYTAKKIEELDLYTLEGEIHHTNHLAIIKNIVSNFQDFVIAQLVHFEAGNNFPKAVDYDSVFAKLNQHLLTTSEDPELNYDLFRMMFKKSGLPLMQFYRRHDSSTAVSAQEASPESSERKHEAKTEEKLPAPQPTAEIDNVLNRIRTCEGVWWPTEEKDIAVQIGLESSFFELPVASPDSKMAPTQYLLQTFKHVQKQVQAIRKNRIAGLLLAYNQSVDQPKLELAVIQSVSIFLSHEISRFVDLRNLQELAELSAHELCHIMQTAIEKFEETTGIKIPRKATLSLLGASPEIVCSQMIYTDMNVSAEQQSQAFPTMQYAMEYLTTMGSSKPGLIYFQSLKATTGSQYSHNRFSMIELLLLFKQHFTDPMALAFNEKDFESYHTARTSLVKATKRLMLLLVAPPEFKDRCALKIINRQIEDDEKELVIADKRIILNKKDGLIYFKNKKNQCQATPINLKPFENLEFTTMITLNYEEIVKGEKDEPDELAVRWHSLPIRCTLKTDEIKFADIKASLPQKAWVPIPRGVIPISNIVVSENSDFLTTIFTQCKRLGGVLQEQKESEQEHRLRTEQIVSSSLPTLKRLEEEFFQIANEIYDQIIGIILQAKPTTDAGLVLKAIFTFFDGNNWIKTPGLLPGLIHLLAYFMNQRDQLSIQAAGGGPFLAHILTQLQKFVLYPDSLSELTDSLSSIASENLEDSFFNLGSLQSLYTRGTIVPPYACLTQVAVTSDPFLNLEELSLSKRRQPRWQDLLRLTCDHPFFRKWVQLTALSPSLHAETLNLFCYTSQHWLTRQEKLALIPDEIKFEIRHTSKDRENITKLMNFWKFEKLALQVETFAPTSRECKIINSLYNGLRAYFNAKMAEITQHNAFYKLGFDEKKPHDLTPILTSNPTTVKEKFDFIEQLNILAVNMQKSPDRDMKLLSSPAQTPEQVYVTPVRSVLNRLGKLKFDDGFFDSAFTQIFYIHPNPYYRYFCKFINPLGASEAKELQKYINSNETDIRENQKQLAQKIKENKGQGLPVHVLLGLEKFLQQQRLLFYFQKDRSAAELITLKKYTDAIDNFYQIFIEAPELKRELRDWRFAKIFSQPCVTTAEKYQFILDLVYLGNKKQAKNSLDTENNFLDWVLGYVANRLSFTNPEQFTKSLKPIIVLLQQTPLKPFQAAPS